MEAETASEVETDEFSASHVLASALKHIDGLIDSVVENSCSPDSSESAAARVIRAATDLRIAIEEMNRMQEAQCNDDDDLSRYYVPGDTLQIIYHWILPLVEKDELIALKNELAISRNDELEQANNKVVKLQQQLQEQTLELERLRHHVNTEEQKKHDERHLVTASPHSSMDVLPSSSNRLRSDSMPAMATHIDLSSPPPLGDISTTADHMIRHDKRRKSLRMKIGSMFGRIHGQNQESIDLTTTDKSSAEEPVVHQGQRAQHFYGLEEEELEAWLRKVGLGKYSQSVLRHAPSGAELVRVTSSQHNVDHLLEIKHPLHQKKLRLAIKAALKEDKNNISILDHNWVADWLADIGLAQYRDIFIDGLIDGNMLNELTYDDLSLLQVNIPFHQVSLKRAIQAWRMSSYHKDYLKVLPDAKGAQQVLRWPASKVSDWLKSIELSNYCDHLEGAGLHGAVMVLDVTFTDESLAELLGIPSNKALLRQHLMLSFMDIIGPVCAQGKLDARKSKHFHHLEPIWRPKLPGRKKHRKKEPIISLSGDTPLCPLPSQSTEHLTQD